jgi:hypothetical protein
MKEEAPLMLQLNPTPLERLAPPPAPLVERLPAGLRPTGQRLARRIVASETAFAVGAFLRCYPRMTIGAGDLARQIARPVGDVAAVLADWTVAGLLEGQAVGGIPFYHLTRDSACLRDLDEVLAWQEFWVSQALGIAEAVGVPLRPLASPAAALLPATTVQNCHLAHAVATGERSCSNR